MKTKTRQINPDVGLKIFLLLGFSAFYLNTIFTGSARLYVHPRIIPYMIFASIIMVIISFTLFGELFKVQKTKTNFWPLLLFVFPFVMAVIFPPVSFDSSVGTSVSFKISNKNNNFEKKEEPLQEFEQKEIPEENISTDKDVENQTESANSIPENGLNLENGVIVMDGDNFYKCLNEVYNNMIKYKGLPIEVVGFVFNDYEGFAENEFVPARFMMTCCAADMVPVGFLCKYDKAKELETDSWVRVKGVIDEYQHEGDTIPIIKASQVEKTNKPKEDYVYPY